MDKHVEWSADTERLGYESQSVPLKVLVYSRARPKLQHGHQHGSGVVAQTHTEWNEWSTACRSNPKAFKGL